MRTYIKPVLVAMIALLSIGLQAQDKKVEKPSTTVKKERASLATDQDVVETDINYQVLIDNDMPPSEEQLKKIAVLDKWTMDEVAKVNAMPKTNSTNRKAKVDAILNKRNAQLEGLFTPEQYEAYKGATMDTMDKPAQKPMDAMEDVEEDN